MEHEAQIDTLRTAIAEVLSMTHEVVGELPEDRHLYSMVLRGITEVVHDHASAIMQLSQGEHTRSSKVLLRTLIESWIIARYVAADDTDRRAKSYIMKEMTETKRLLDGLLRLALAAEEPNEQSAVLASAGLTSLEDLESRIARQQQDIDKAKQRGVPSFPNIVDCAKAVGLEVTYRTVYGYLLSGQVHARAGDTLRSQLVEARVGDDLYKVLLTSLFLMVEMLGMTSAHFGRPGRESLVKFESLLKELHGLG